MYAKKNNWFIDTRYRRILFLGLVAFLCFLMAFFIAKNLSKSLFSNKNQDLGILQSSITPLDIYYHTQTTVVGEIKAKETLSAALVRMGLSLEQANIFAASLSKNAKSNDKLVIYGAYDDRLLQDKKPFIAEKVEIYQKDNNGIAYSISSCLKNDTNVAQVTTNKPDIHKTPSIISGKVTNTLYGSMINSGAQVNLVNSFSDIFAWQIDFYRETKQGDIFKLVVEKIHVDGRFMGYGPIVAAEYISNKKKLRAFNFSSKDNKVMGFFDEAGQSLKNAFLKAPIKLASISSRFGMRFHPVQKRHKPHNGIDYGARRGTPFVSVASGVVINAGYNQFNGHWARIKHTNGYDTEYLHATHLAKGIRVGAKISQGQVIGYVGSTGLASGPHLHFGMRKQGKYIDPVKQTFNRASGIPKTHMKEFLSQINPLVIAFNQNTFESSKVASKQNINPDDA